MTLSLNLGFPRIGDKRQLKKATESYWKGEISQADLIKTGQELRHHNWQLQKDAGLDILPVGDFSFYDQILDMSCLLGNVPERYGWSGDSVDMDIYFAMARGNDKAPAMEMTKWFDTNYHYIVPEFEEGKNYKISSNKIFDEFQEALDAGFTACPIFVGPATYVFLGKAKYDEFDPAATINALVPVYCEILKKLEAQGASWVMLDEPMLAMDMCESARKAIQDAYTQIRKELPELNICVNSYFEALRENTDTAFSLPIQALHIDLVRAPEQFDTCLAKAKDKGIALSLGLVDGRNIWKNDLSASIEVAEKAVQALGADNVVIGPSCSLIHSPIDLDNEDKIDPEIKNWMAYAKQKLDEISTINKAARDGRDSVENTIKASDEAQQDRKTSKRIHNKEVKDRVASITPDMAKRKSPYAERRKVQQAEIKLPAFPTTTIGSFPQTPDIRKARADFKRGDIDQATYEEAMKKEIQTVIDFQEEIDLDVLVHGEPERNDMVEYFGEQLEGFVFSRFGWVQSYGSRYVKPPIIFGDISRPDPMTVKWAEIAQSMTGKIMKGMLTGPITILQWSFVRNDQPRSETTKQLALAIRDEVADLEKAGIKVIQIDEAAIREGLPLRKDDWKDYLTWSVEAFRLTACTVDDTTQIHTHMCYSEFNDMIESIGDMDADVISIETSRSQMELLDAFASYKYPNEIGPGVYDIHSPRIPSKEDMIDLLEKAAQVISPDQIWVNPDCGLKTRGWAEVKPALVNMVDAAKELRQKQENTEAA